MDSILQLLGLLTLQHRGFCGLTRSATTSLSSSSLAFICNEDASEEVHSYMGVEEEIKEKDLSLVSSCHISMGSDMQRRASMMVLTTGLICASNYLCPVFEVFVYFKNVYPFQCFSQKCAMNGLHNRNITLPGLQIFNSKDRAFGVKQRIGRVQGNRPSSKLRHQFSTLEAAEPME